MDGSYALPCGAVCAREATPGHIFSPATDGTQVGLSSLAPARKMIELLQSADAAVASDQARARQLIDRVVNILRTTLDERENAPAARWRHFPSLPRRLGSVSCGHCQGRTIGPHSFARSCYSSRRWAGSAQVYGRTPFQVC